MAGKAACRCPVFVASCRAGRIFITRASTRAAAGSHATARASLTAWSSTRPTTSAAPPENEPLKPQVSEEPGLQPQQRLFVVQPGAVDEEDVLRALAQRVDLRADDVDVG